MKSQTKINGRQLAFFLAFFLPKAVSEIGKEKKSGQAE